jgi:enamine deaminase RidA (YjgF/YER057c/UK114 family)
MAEREIYSGNPPVRGLALAVKAGGMIYVAGTTAHREGQAPVEGMEAQMRETYARIAQSLAHFGATLTDVVEQTVFVTDMDAALAARHVRLEAYGAAGDAFPASATVEVSRLGRPGLLVEIKVSARVPETKLD